MGSISDLNDKELKEIVELINKAPRIDEVELFRRISRIKSADSLPPRIDTGSACLKDIVIEW